ncbi:MAG TPA: thiamine pyrophosphate-dependent enzyme [Anaerolineae bacterium]|nr:thiamine pyrophosphate-dependent enzyme [Anaerolineae bacterium]
MIGEQENTILHNLTAKDIIRDYQVAFASRQASLIGRREVLSGKAKFGIFGDGKEVAQVALARSFQHGDTRSGYYRDQTIMFALGMMTIEQFFAQLYAHPDVNAEPASAGRSMNGHYGTRQLDDNGQWLSQTDTYNTSADVSPTGSQMPRLVGLAYASRLYRDLPDLHQYTNFSKNGNEVAFGTIGNASCAEGMFWEAVNAVGVLGAPLVLSIWDDGYGISVPNKYQITKEDLTALLSGFQREAGSQAGYDLYTVKGWDYAQLVNAYQEATTIARDEHVPSIIHVIEVTQPQGHSTSGSHERYKTAERLAWEEEYDCLLKMREWILAEGIATAEELDQVEAEAKAEAENAREQAWEKHTATIMAELNHVADMLDTLAASSQHGDKISASAAKLRRSKVPYRKDSLIAIRDALILTRDENLPTQETLRQWQKEQEALNYDRYSSHLYSQSDQSARNVPVVPPSYSNSSPTVNGSEIMNTLFDTILARDPRVIAFGEDVGHLGDVNQGFVGLQEKYGELRVSDTGIRETTILGQAIGLAMRGLRPIAEIQYLDYILYALQIMSDDLATLQWRTKGGQKAPVIIRTRGHRLEGIWHSGSPIAGIMNLIQGIYLLVPRNMTQAAGFYNTLFQSDEPGLIIEVLNSYRLKEKLPDNIDTMTIPLGTPEILRQGSDITVVTYGACCPIALNAAAKLSEVGIEAEVIDVQSLIPFDTNHMIVDSLKKTSNILFLDEDVPGGTTAFMLQKVLEEQGGYWWLDGEPRTLSAKPHRPPYGSDGNYFSKPNVEEIFDVIYEMMHEIDPQAYPIFYK